MEGSTLISSLLDPPTKRPYSAIVRVPEGTQVTLSCPVDGRPEPNITWYKGNDTTAEVQHQGREWKIQAASDDTGWYSCSAKNLLNLFKPVNVNFQLVVGKFTCLLIMLLSERDGRVKMGFLGQRTHLSIYEHVFFKMEACDWSRESTTTPY